MRACNQILVKLYLDQIKMMQLELNDLAKMYLIRKKHIKYHDKVNSNAI